MQAKAIQESALAAVERKPVSRKAACCKQSRTPGGVTATRGSHLRTVHLEGVDGDRPRLGNATSRGAKGCDRTLLAHADSPWARGRAGINAEEYSGANPFV